MKKQIVVWIICFGPPIASPNALQAFEQEQAASKAFEKYIKTRYRQQDNNRI